MNVLGTEIKVIYFSSIAGFSCYILMVKWVWQYFGIKMNVWGEMGYFRVKMNV